MAPGMRLILLFVAIAVVYAQELNVAAGAKIFRSHCGECHGVRGEGGRGPSLASGVFYHGNTDADLIANISDGIPGTAMPGVFFSPVQVRQIVAYVRSLAENGARKPAGEVTRGEKLFREKGCIGCHLVRGEGGWKGPDLSVIGSQRSLDHLRQSILDPNAKVSLDYWVAKITLENGETYTGFLRTEGAYTVEMLDFSKGLKSLATHDFLKFEIDKKSIMPSYRGRLTDGELDDVVAYLWSLKRPGGSR
jgi:putative heme-binding domain-containing protein